MNILRYRSFWLSLFLTVILASMILPAQAQDGERRVDQGVAFLQANNIPPEAYVELSATITNPQKAAEILIKYGYTPEQVQTFMTPQNILTMSSILNPGPSNEIIAQAMGILAPYNLSMTDLTALMPNLTNPQAMVATLMEKGLTQEQASQLLTEAGPLIQQASETGMVQYAVINDQVGSMLTQAGFDTMLMYQMGNIINDPEAITAYMREKGYTDAQIQTFQGMASGMTAQGITPELLEGWTVKNMVYRLEGIGLDPTMISEVVALGNIDAVREYLTEMGYDGDTLELALTNIEGCLGQNGEVLDPERLETFQAGEAAQLLNDAGIDPADLGDILAMKDDPEAMSDYLAEMYGMTPEQIAAFEKGLDNSTFAKTVDPEEADDFIANVESAIEEQESTGDDYGDEYSDDYTDDYGDEYSDDYADDYGDDYGDVYGDDYSDDYSGGGTDDYSGGGDAGGDDSGDDYGE